ncbi:hypothetical protein [Micromonospora sp. NPDC005197]|uniref:hypothetical protein n=1 Tax=Micromonospora sp. NPDC005197 TaxID=3157020 RepID=UPI0033B1E35F
MGYAAELLAWFAPDEAALAGLMAVPDDAARAATRASANLTLAHCPVGSERVDARLRELLSANAAVVRVTAAVGLAYRLGDQLPDLALDVLTDARSSDFDAEVPGWDRSMRGFVALARSRLTCRRDTRFSKAVASARTPFFYHGGCAVSR